MASCSPTQQAEPPVKVMKQSLLSLRLLIHASAFTKILPLALLRLPRHLIFSLAKVAPFTPSIAFDGSLIGEAEDALLGMYNGIASRKYLSSSHGSVGLTCRSYPKPGTNTWYEVHHDVDADRMKSSW